MECGSRFLPWNILSPPPPKFQLLHPQGAAEIFSFLKLLHPEVALHHLSGDRTQKGFSRGELTHAD